MVTGMVALSVLDLAVVRERGTSAEALADTTRLAQAAERLGFVRFWVAEHHNMPTVASTSPAVLIAHVAGATTHIRVGSGGVMLTNHAPLAIAEQFAMLEALHPGRIDLGLGRAPGTDPMTASAFGRHPHESVQHFLPYRSGTVHDWLVDVSAATVAATALGVLLARVPMPQAPGRNPIPPR